MGQWIYRILVGISLLLAMGFCGLWFESHGWIGDVYWVRDGRGYCVGYKAGYVYFQTMKKTTPEPDLKASWRMESGNKYSNARLNDSRKREGQTGWYCEEVFVGILHETYRPGNPAKFHAVYVPFYWPVLLTSLIPGWALGMTFRRKWIIRRRGERGLCIQCGYDLRATPERCPECGTARGGVMNRERGRGKTDISTVYRTQREIRTEKGHGFDSSRLQHRAGLRTGKRDMCHIAIQSLAARVFPTLAAGLLHLCSSVFIEAYSPGG